MTLTSGAKGGKEVHLIACDNECWSSGGAKVRISLADQPKALEICAWASSAHDWSSAMQWMHTVKKATPATAEQRNDPFSVLGLAKAYSRQSQEVVKLHFYPRHTPSGACLAPFAAL